MADDGSSAASIVNVYQQTNIVQINYITATALFCFDYCLTFGQEVELVWKRGFSTSAVLFYAVRYPAFFSTIFVIMDMTPFRGMSDWSCGILIHMDMALNIILLTAAAVFSSLRVYALWDRNRWVLAAVLLLGMANPAISIYTFVLMQPVMFTWPSPACGFVSSIPDVIYENWMIGARMSSVVADVLVLVATWTRTWPMRTEAARVNLKATFAAILMRDGTLYFIVLLVANVVALGLGRQIELIEPISTWIAILTAILTSRFILDLQHAANALGTGEDAGLSALGTLPSIVFRNVSQHESTAASPPRRSGSVYGAMVTHMSATTESEGEWVSSDGSDATDPRSLEKDEELIRSDDLGVAV